MALAPWPAEAVLDNVRIETTEGYKPYTVTYKFHFWREGVTYLRSVTFNQANEGMTDAEFNVGVGLVEGKLLVP